MISFEAVAGRGPHHQIHLAAEARSPLEQHDLVPALGRDARRLHPRRTAADDHHLPAFRGRRQHRPFAFAAGHRVVDAPHPHADVDVPDTALGACDAGADVAGATLAGLVRQVRIGNERARHPDEVRGAFRDEPLRDGRRIEPAGPDHGQGHVLLDSPRQMRERAGRIVVRGPVGAAAARARDDALPHVEAVHLAVRLEQACDLFIVVEPQAVVLQIVVHADAEDAPAPDRIAHHIHRLVHERHPLFERRAAVAVLPAVRLRAQEIGEEVVHPDGELDPVQIARLRPARRRGELVEGLLDLGQRHRMGNELRGGEIGRRHRRRRLRRPCEKRRPVRDPPPAMPELSEERHVVRMGRRRHSLVHRHDAVVVARERERHVAVVVRHGMPGHRDTDAALRPLAHVIHITLGREAVSGLEVRGMTGIHDPVLQRVRPDGDGTEQMRERVRHDDFPPQVSKMRVMRTPR